MKYSCPNECLIYDAIFLFNTLERKCRTIEVPYQYKFPQISISRNPKNLVPSRSLEAILCQAIDLLSRKAATFGREFISPRPLAEDVSRENLFTDQGSRSVSARKNRVNAANTSGDPVPCMQTSKCETCVTICGRSCVSRGVL